MRRFLFSLFSLGLISSLFGCGILANHTAGVCDCRVGRDWCNYVSANGGDVHIRPVGAVAPATATVPVPVPIAPETIKELPKELPGKILPPIDK